MACSHRRIIHGIWLTVMGMLFAVGCFAAEGMSTFARLQFGDDASIEVPRNWTFLDKNIRQHLNTYSEAVAKFAGIDVNQGNNQILAIGDASLYQKRRYGKDF